jgi:hypothetical protein
MLTMTNWLSNIPLTLRCFVTSHLSSLPSSIASPPSRLQDQLECFRKLEPQASFTRIAIQFGMCAPPGPRQAAVVLAHFKERLPVRRQHRL